MLRKAKNGLLALAKQPASRDQGEEEPQGLARLSPGKLRRRDGCFLHVETWNRTGPLGSGSQTFVSARALRSFRTPSSASSRDSVSAGRKRMADAPEASAMSP